MKYFIFSDIHSFFTPLKTALDEKGFDLNNPNHCCVVLGDIFDRGKETRQIYNFLKSIPEDRLVLVRGNHEYLFENLLEKEYPDSYDFSNGTVRTFCSMAYKQGKKIKEKEEFLFINASLVFNRQRLSLIDSNLVRDDGAEALVAKQCIELWKDIVKKVKKSEIYQWFKTANWVNYWEEGNFIGVHSFIPLRLQPYYDSKQLFYHVYNSFVFALDYIPDWRENASADEWESATWGCPYRCFDSNLFKEEIKKGKTLICGHWSASDFNKRYLMQKNNFNAYIGKNLIALDATTALSNQVNVLVIEDNKIVENSD